MKIAAMIAFSILFTSCSAQKRVAAAGGNPPIAGVPSTPPIEGAPALKPSVPGFIRYDQQEDASIQAVAAVPEFERLQSRFISCSDEYNSDGVVAMENCKQGVIKALNSISSEVDLAIPKSIGPGGSILQVELDDFGLTPQKWRLIEDADPFNAAFTSETVRGRTLQFLTQTARPMINGQIFAEAALVKAYYGVTDTPGTFDQLQRQLGVNLQRDFDNRDPDVLVMGMNESVIASNRQFRMIYRTKGTFGALWCTEDIDDQVIAPVQINNQLINQKNLLEAPFPVFARSPKTYVQNAGECIYLKPNGTLGFFLSNAAGERQDFAPTNIVQDTSGASRGLSGTIQNARSCFGCHATGFIEIKDKIGPHIASNTSFNGADKTLGRLFYKSADTAQRMFDEDNKKYADSLAGLGVTNPTEDVINNLTDKLRLEKDARQVASMLGIPEDELKIDLAASTGASAILGPLLQPGGKVNLQTLIDGLPILIEDANYFKDDE